LLNYLEFIFFFCSSKEDVVIKVNKVLKDIRDIESKQYIGELPTFWGIIVF
jgi:hypothetical protein